LPPEQLGQLRALLNGAGFTLYGEKAADAKLIELRGMYEPFVNALAERFLFALPEFVPAAPNADNWQRSAWMKRAPGIGSLPIAETGDEHFA
jgi:hypothetical protein